MRAYISALEDRACLSHGLVQALWLLLINVVENICFLAHGKLIYATVLAH